MDLCDRCLGRRLVGAAGAEPQEAAAREARGPTRTALPPEECPVCEGAFLDVDAWEQAALQELEGRAYTTVQVGTRFPKPCEDAERESAAAHDQPLGESVRTEANRLLAARIAERTGATTATEGRPDIVVDVDTRFWTASARANSVFIAGRYTKHRRDLPQTHWPCKTCQGLGCHACAGAGVMYASSVEDVLAATLVPAFGAQGASFHGAGREDIDALMLGTGRPFVLELHDPRHRSLELGPAQDTINAATAEHGVGVRDLQMTGKEEVARIKAAEYDKAYLAHCETADDVAQKDVEDAAASLAGRGLEQRTPERVSHRRADLVRRRTVHEVRVESFADPRHFTLYVRAESGTYIKEFISGDDGRTSPSFAQHIGSACHVVALDVMGVID